MPDLKIIEGRLSERYDHFREYRFLTCQATDTRLMGVVALKVTWRGVNDPRAKFYQVIHLDYSEYGIDDYFEFECIPGTDDYGDNKEEMMHHWRLFMSSMGGSTVSIGADVMLRLIDSALPLTDDGIDREYDDAENRDFRRYAVMRLGLMKDSLAAAGITAESCPAGKALKAVSRRKLQVCETINYFIMRLVDHDFDAAASLSSIDRRELESCELAAPGIQTLIRSSLKTASSSEFTAPDGRSFPYRATITTLGRKGYYHSSFIIYLDGDYSATDPKVTGLEVGSHVRLNEFESAMQVSQKEYITVFDCPDRLLDGFDGRLISPLSDSEPSAVPNGWLYTAYKKDNDHVNKPEYRIGDDVVGYALLTIGGEFILMSNHVDGISKLDSATLFSAYSPLMTMKGRYLLERTPVFQSLCGMPGVLFGDLIDTRD